MQQQPFVSFARSWATHRSSSVSCIWTRRHIGAFRGQPFDQTERIYLGRVAAFEPRPSRRALREHGPEDIRWWTAGELEAADAEFAPRRLPALVRELLRSGPPSLPVDVGE